MARRSALAAALVALAACSSDPPPTTAIAPSASTSASMASHAAPSASVDPPASARPPATMPPAPSASVVASTAPPAIEGDAGCLTDKDCAWGEIGRDITGPDDCMCLFGCPYLPTNVPTAKRRTAQYARYCRPGFGAGGGRCPIDDCAMPPPIVCRGNVCQAR